MSKIKHIALLGATGSIGTQTLEVIAAHPELFKAEVLTAHRNAALLIQQARTFLPNVVVIGEESLYEQVRDALADLPIKVYTGEKALCEVVQMEQIDVVLTALVGYAGLQPTLHAIRAGKPIALANKETLVVAGELVTALAEEYRVPILPVDSEHSAIFQCLVGEFHNPIEKIILTASGGPFRGMRRAELETVTRAQALKHPNWEMGAKITIDSASMMNKGLEVIEAKWLFGLAPEQIEVIVHPQSIIHSIVQFQDSSMKAQMGLPDMRVPIQFALSYPDRLQATFPRFDFLAYPALTFEQPDMETFRNLKLAFWALEQGGNAPCVLNASNEVVVEAFLREKIGFLAMSEVIEDCLARVPYQANASLEQLIASDEEARAVSAELIQKLVNK
ncbi:1-deoxy-D-xylulose 5-phosphate reductoisomerase [Nitritalea halalkaliphila LW7]|uniref:1-deoxy-D-xylulose 5-phosphate reductoisomerase n=1 Tax=Nitritalea halalkaliphila LW7 TaxID=1189621 RepID=I5C1N8_9BACT|nr:1-deoxy-D-xylulose-5-phosphate reductoisomerase [Nitritalea halalkaliphila]EIM75740.1 1-deoxy-D-xylulose 5-phosphate reductoisomerase [Nitritalea halalkaliphila LW7]